MHLLVDAIPYTRNFSRYVNFTDFVIFSRAAVKISSVKILLSHYLRVRSIELVSNLHSYSKMIIKISGILFGQLSVKPWTANVKLKILRIFTWSVYGSMALQLAMYYVSSHASACYFFNTEAWWCLQTHFDGLQAWQ